MLTCGQLVVHPNPWSFPAELLSSQVSQPAPLSGIIALEVWDFIIPFVELHDFPASPFLQFIGVLKCRTGLSAVSKEAVQFAEFALHFLRVYEG